MQAMILRPKGKMFLLRTGKGIVSTLIPAFRSSQLRQVFFKSGQRRLLSRLNLQKPFLLFQFHTGLRTTLVFLPLQAQRFFHFSSPLLTAILLIPDFRCIPLVGTVQALQAGKLFVFWHQYGKCSFLCIQF